MINGDQIRAGRALVRWSARELAQAAGLSISTVQRMEKSEGIPSGYGRNIEAVQKALEGAGVVFIDANGGGVGVRL